jgi:hypothetical protein
LLLQPAYALAAQFVLHASLAGIFTWLFATRLGLGIPARVAAALTYMFSGPLLLGGIYMGPYLATQAWLPAILWALHGLLEQARVVWAIALALVASLAFLAGSPQTFLYEAQFALAYGAFGLGFVGRPGLRLRALGLAALAGLLALGLVGPQLLATVELTQRSLRSFQGMPVEVASAGSIGWVNLLWGLLGYFDPQPWALSLGPVRWRVTLPAATIPLALCGVLAGRQRAHWLLFLAAAALAGLFMLGDESPVFPIYHALPLGDLFRNPARMAFLYVFLAAMILGIGLQGATEGLQTVTGRPLLATSIAVLVSALTAAEVYARTNVGYAHPILGMPFAGAPKELTDYLLRQPGNPRVFIEQTTVLPKPTLLFKTGMMHGFSAVPDYEANMPAAYKWYFGVVGGIWHGRLTVLPARSHLPPEVMGRLLDLMSVRYYAVLRPSQGPAPASKALGAFVGGTPRPLGSVDILERPTALERVYAVRRAVLERDLDAAWRRMTQGPFDPHREVVVVPSEDGRDAAPLSGIAADETAGPPDTAAITAYATDEVTITADCAARCLLVLTDLHYPGWRAYVDNRQTPVHRVNTLFRGVYLEPGAHRVVYRYEPLSVRVGAWMVLAALGIAMAAPRLERRRPT